MNSILNPNGEPVESGIKTSRRRKSRWWKKWKAYVVAAAATVGVLAGFTKNLTSLFDFVGVIRGEESRSVAQDSPAEADQGRKRTAEQRSPAPSRSESTRSQPVGAQTAFEATDFVSGALKSVIQDFGSTDEASAEIGKSAVLFGDRVQPVEVRVEHEGDRLTLVVSADGLDQASGLTQISRPKVIDISLRSEYCDVQYRLEARLSGEMAHFRIDIQEQYLRSALQEYQATARKERAPIMC